jgi:hypothetical protein
MMTAENELQLKPIRKIHIPEQPHVNAERRTPNAKRVI